MILKKYKRFIKKNYVAILAVLFFFFIGIVVLFKFFSTSTQFIYVKMKVGQGYWWVNTAKPASWYSNAVKKGDKVYDLMGKPSVEVLEVRTYPSSSSYNGSPFQFDQYVTVKMQVKYNSQSGQYSYSRAPVLIGSPLQLQFPLVNITGSIIDISTLPFRDEYVTKVLTLAYQGGYNKDFPYRFDTLNVGDKYFDGVDTVFEVTDKELGRSIWAVSNNLNGQVYEQSVEATQNIIVKAKVKVRSREDGYYYAEEYRMVKGLQIPFSTHNYYFDKFIIGDIE